MSEHPILFSPPMVKAILEGRKTQTRRVIKPQPVNDENVFYGPHWLFRETSPLSPINKYKKVFCPYGQPGDHLWVRETWQRCPECGRVVYQDSSNQNGKVCPNCDEWLGSWKPSIHMFRENSRITLEVVNVRIERLQDITNEDALNEGVETELWDMAVVTKKYGTRDGWFQDWGDGEGYSNYSHIDTIFRDSFKTLWNSINEKRGYGWDTNPWVWVVEFKKI